MNAPDHNLESRLRRAPSPPPPAGLKTQIMSQIELPQPGQQSSRPGVSTQSWWKRWWPALAATGASVFCLAVLAGQQAQLRQLEQEVESLRRELQAGPRHIQAENPAPSTPVPDGAAELASLQAEAQKLAAEIRGLEAVKAQNQQLKAEAARQQNALDPEEVQAMQQAKDRASRIQCVNNLKNLGLAARIWATDNQDVNPPNIEAMMREIASPSLLTCPGDPARKPAKTWPEYTPANLSYEYLAASAPTTEPNRVLFRCPVHQNVTLVDGSVQQLSAARATRDLVQQDGKLYLGPPPPATPATTPAPGTGMSEEMMKRYGLTPPANGAPPNPGAPAPTYQMSPAMMKRYGLMPNTNPPANPNP